MIENTFKGATRTKQIFVVPTLKLVVTPASLIEQENGYGTRFGCHRHGHSSHGLRTARGDGGLESRGCRRKAVRRQLRATRLRSKTDSCHGRGDNTTQTPNITEGWGEGKGCVEQLRS